LDDIADKAEAANDAAVLAANRVALFNENVEYIYPDTTDITVTLSSPGTADTWGNWTRIIASDAGELSDVFVGASGYLSEVTLHSYNYPDSRVIVEIGIGNTGNNTVGRVFMFTDFTYMIKFHSEPIPANSVLYYRMMCSHVSETLQARFKYYYN